MSDQMSRTEPRDPNILGSLLKRFLPDPMRADQEPYLATMSREEGEVLDALTARLGVTSDSLKGSRADRTKFVGHLSDLLAEAILQSDNGVAAAARLGDRGVLSLSQYRISYPDSFKAFEEFGMKRSHVDEVVRRPDAVQHMSEIIASGEFPGLTLIGKKITPKRNSPFYVLVQADRRGNDLVIQGAWRIPQSFVPAGGEKLIDILEEFVKRYGLYIDLPDRVATKFIYYDAVPVPDGNLKAIFGVQNPTNAKFLVTLMVRVSTLRVAQIALGFAINLDEYVRDFNDEVV